MEYFYSEFRRILFLFFLFSSVRVFGDVTVFSPKDLGGMFNERGFMKSNSASFDDKEIINDFNGNLMYSIPLTSGKGEGELSYSLSLNYNGSVNYQITASDPDAQYWNSGELHEYNFSAPGWIVSFNGFAIQMLNFENYFFTRPSSANYEPTKGRYVRMLAKGYQITDEFQFASAGNKNKITIMLGDGSTETLQNTIGGTYTGDYVSTSKQSTVRARVEFIEGGSIADYSKRRRMYYMKGDGLTYIFEEQEVNYKDLFYTIGVAEKFRQLVFMLKQVKDRFGNVYDLDYQLLDGDAKCGRHLASLCPGASFTYQSFWGTNFGFAIDTKDGRYLLYTETFGLPSESNHRPSLLKLLNPSGESMNFGYQPYIRKGLNLYKNSSKNFDIRFGDGGDYLYRLSGVSNFDGRVNLYTYFDQTYGVDATTLSYTFSPSEKGAHSSAYYGQGRDLFFTNSLKTATVKLNGNTVRSDEFSYVYYPSRSYSEVWEKPIFERDEYYTYRTTASGQSESQDNGTIQSKSSKKTYKNYPRFFKQNGTTDFDGENKLVEERFYTTDVNSPYQSTTFEYDLGDREVVTGNDTVYTGSFYETKKTQTINGISSEWNTVYTPLQGNSPLLAGKITIDPFGKIDSTAYQNFLYTNYHFRIFENGTCTRFDSGFAQPYDSVYLYLANLPLVQISRKNGVVLSMSENIYSTDTSIANTDTTINQKAYPGQLIATKVYNANNFSDYLTTRFIYANKDSIGKHLYNNHFRSALEGNLRVVIGPAGDSIRYYYDIISRREDKSGLSDPCVGSGVGDEVNCAPKFTYTQVNDTGTVTLLRSSWSDSRLPTRIDKQVGVNRYLTSYQSYDLGGNPTGIVDNNNFFSRIDYDKYYRISLATLPYDFNTRKTRDTVIFVDSTIINGELNPKTRFWGYRDNGEEVGDVTYSPSNNLFCIQKNIFLDEGKDAEGIDVSALFVLDTIGFHYIDRIDSAFIDLSAYFGTATHNNTDTLTNLRYLLIPVKNYQNGTYEEGTGSLNMGNLNLTTASACVSDSSSIASYEANKRRFNITNLLRDNLDNGLNIDAFKIDLQFLDYFKDGILTAEVRFNVCNNNFSEEWKQKYLPKITFYGRKKFVDSLKIVKYSNGTLAYSYDDVHNKVTVNSKIDGIGASNRYKTTDNFFDGLARLYKTKSYYDNTLQLYDSSGIEYNYLDQKAKTTDGRNNSVKIRYDIYGNPDSTGNADNSYSKVITTYINGLINTWDTIPGLVTKQEMFDEEGNRIEKYTDALGNLRREKRFVELPGVEVLYDELITDYKYDNLYRVVQVRTPNDRRIYYTYDGFGRQTQRETPDAGIVKYKYDEKGNLRFSQDANQSNAYTESPPSKKFTFRRYDAGNRLLCIGETAAESNSYPSWTSLNPDTVSTFESYNDFPEHFLVVNAYDTISTSIGPNFAAPTGYTSEMNYTNGNLAATAYRTRSTDAWNYKFYRYDARGRVIRMWNVINGLGTKITDYLYNSQNQVQIFTYQSGDNNEQKVTMYEYDDAGRLKDVFVPSGNEAPGIGDNPPSGSLNFASYHYNQNSQIDTLKLNGKTNKVGYTYNYRNWVHTAYNNLGVVDYSLNYLYNGNISSMNVSGAYNNNFSTAADIYTNFTYDKANRLLSSKYASGYYYTDDSLTNTYDRDGNILTLRRKSNSDNFNYLYVTNTNKLRRVSDSTDQFAYDYNGNLVSDELNKNYDAVYDYRNLLIFLRSEKLDENNETPSTITHLTRYYYDEAGNRVRKVVYKESKDNIESDPDWEAHGDNNDWILVADEYYVRDAGGKEIADYSNTNINFWNIYGADNIGRINADTTKQFYLKDHLGSIRAVTNSSNALIAAYDYDAWGYKLREWKSGDDAKYRFTGKERDNETNYDYFGARYYDSRIGRWGGTDALFEKHIDFTPYNYVLDNQMILVDPDGKQITRYEPAKQQRPELMLPGTNSLPLRELGQAISSGIAGLGAAIGTGIMTWLSGSNEAHYSKTWTFENPYNLSEGKEITPNSQEEDGPKEQDLRKLSPKEVEKLAKDRNYEGKKAIHEMKDDDMQGLESKGGKVDYYIDKKSKDIYLGSKGKGGPKGFIKIE